MSVDVKAPNKAQFEHPEFPCGGRDTALTVQHQQSPTEIDSVTVTEIGSIGAGHQDRPTTLALTKALEPYSAPSKYFRKRRNTYSAPGDRNASGAFPPSFRKRFRREKMVPVRNFQLGGNINDPLNLESMRDEDINRALNESTPHSSPLPLPAHRQQQVQVLIPPNITDPLNLNSGEDMDPNLLSPKGQGKKKRKKSRKRNQSSAETPNVSLEENTILEKDFSKPMQIEIVSDSELQRVSLVKPELESPNLKPCVPEVTMRKGINQIVSPVIPQISPKRKRKRTSSEGSGSSVSRPITLKEDIEKTSPKRPKYRRQTSSHSSCSQTSTLKPKQKASRKKSPKKFIYGNYNRYYGYRNPDSEQDDRLRCLKQEWFETRDVLDIGCNVGHVTLAIARNFHPRKIVGMDIDGSLIAAARRNVRFYLSKDFADTSKFPSNMLQCYGPIVAPTAPDATNNMPQFPENVAFVQGNYVLERDELLEMQHEEYDVILALSVTKWIHFNWGDAGLKRFFRRIFRQLRPGGKLILEPQAWASYKKKKNLTEDISRNFSEIKLRPEQFREYLLSREVGFSKSEVIDMPFNRAKGFQRPIQVFSKAETAQVTPRVDQWSTVATPSYMDSRGATPSFLVGSSGNVTPSSSGIISRVMTPRMDDDCNVVSSSMSDIVSRATTPKQDDDGNETIAAVPENELAGVIRSISAPALLEMEMFVETMSPISEEATIPDTGQKMTDSGIESSDGVVSNLEQFRVSGSDQPMCALSDLKGAGKEQTGKSSNRCGASKTEQETEPLTVRTVMQIQDRKPEAAVTEEATTTDP